MMGLSKARKLPPPSPLVIAVGRNDAKAVEDILRRGASVHDTGTEGVDALSVAAILGYTEIARVLLDNGANVDFRSKGATPLMKAIMMDHAATARLLIDRGANINAATDDGLTALIYSVQRNSMELMQLLLDKGADVSMKEYRGYTACRLAEEWKREAMVPLLKEAEQFHQYQATAIEKQRMLNNVALKSRMIRKLRP
jgi:ankyrin repeat protein